MKVTTVKKVFGLLALAIITININACGQTTSLVNPIQVRNYQTQNNASQTQLLVKFKIGVQAQAIQLFHNQYGTRTVDMIAGIGVHVIEIPVRTSVQQLLTQLNADPRVEYAEANQTITIANTDSARYIPGQSAGELLVQFKKSTQNSAIHSFHQTYGTKTVKVLTKIGVHVIKVPAGAKITELLKEMQADERVKFVEINKDVHINPDAKKAKGIQVKPIKK